MTRLCRAQIHKQGAEKEVRKGTRKVISDGPTHDNSAKEEGEGMSLTITLSSQYIVTVVLCLC